MIVAYTNNAKSTNSVVVPLHYSGVGVSRGRTLCGKPFTEHWMFKEVRAVDQKKVCRHCQRVKESL